VIVVQTIPEHLRWQAESCAQLGSPLYAHLLARAAEDVEEGGPIARVLGDRQATNGSALGLRLMGSVPVASTARTSGGWGGFLPGPMSPGRSWRQNRHERI